MNNKFTKIFDIISKTKGDVLDIGFGWGISANHFYNNGVKSLTIIEKRKDVYQGFFEGDLRKDIDEIAEGRMQSLVDEMLNRRQKPKEIVKRQNKTDLMHNVEIPEFTELKATYEKPIVARKIMHLTDLMNKHALGGTELSIIFNYLLDNLDLSKISDEQREYIGDKLKYGEQEGE